MKNKNVWYLDLVFISFFAIYSIYIFKTQSISQWWANDIIYSVYLIIAVLGTVKNMLRKHHSYTYVLGYLLTIITSLLLMTSFRYNYQFRYGIVLMIFSIVLLINELYNLLRESKKRRIIIKK